MSDVIAPAKPDTAQLQKALGQVNESMVPGNKEQCPSCDKTGLAVLVTLYGVIPTQNYGKSRYGGYDWVNDADVIFDQAGYLASRKLNEAKAGGMLECSHYVVRTLRKGYLYIHYPDDKSWEIYAVQDDGRLLRMQLDMGHAMGIGDAHCARLKQEAGAFLLTVDPKKHPTFYAAFSDAKWTKNVREKVVQPDPAAYMKLVNIDGQRELVSVADTMIEQYVLGFQDNPMRETENQEAYPRVPCVSPKGVAETMNRLNKPYNKGALILPLEDDIGIATQLNFLRNSALLDIMGEGNGYSEDDKNKMATAGLMQNLKDGLGDIWSSIEENIDKKQFDRYLRTFTACEDAKANFDTLSADYTQWMQYLLGRKHHRLFDPELPEAGLQLGAIVGDLFEGAGLTNEEYEKVLLPQFTADATSENQLFWRGAAANDSKLLVLLADPSIDKTILEGRKKYGEGKEQITLLREVREVRAETIKHNEISWTRLSRVLATRARYLHDTDAKTFRRTLRRIQAVALATQDIGILIASAQGDATGYLNLLWQEQVAHTESGGKIKLTPKNQGQTFALMAWLARAWRPGQPAPEGLVEAANALNISLDDIPKLKRPTIEEAPATKGGMRMLVGLNASLAAVQA